MSAYIVFSTLLNANVNVTGLCSAQIYPDISPQTKSRPAIVYTEISRIPQNTIGTNGKSSLDVSRMQITIGAITRKAAEDIGIAVRACLDYVNNTTIGGYYVDWIIYESANSFYDGVADQDGLYILTQDYQISIRQ